MLISRRQLLGGAATGAIALALAGCATGQNAGATLQQAISDAELIANGLAAALPQLGKVFTAGVLAKASAAIADIKTAAAAVAAAVSASAAQPAVAQLAAAVNGLVAALAGLPLPAPISTALAAAAVLLPIIESTVGMAITAVTAHALPAMTPGEARKVLAAMAAK